MHSKQASVANVSGVSTAPGLSICYLNGNKSPKEGSLGSCMNTRRNSREGFCKKLFLERPKSRKLSYKLKQSSDFDDNDRHFSLDESRLQGSKSRKLSDGFDGATDSKKLRNQSFQGTENFQNPSQLQKKFKGNSQTGQLQQFEQTSNGSTPFRNPKQNYNQRFNSAQEELDSQNNLENKESKQRGRGQIQKGEGLEQKMFQHMTETVNQYRNTNDIETNFVRQTGSHVIEAGNGTNQNNLLESVRDSEAIKESKMLYNSTNDDNEPLQSGLLLRSVFYTLLLSVLISLASYNYGDVYIFTFVNSVLYGISFALLLIYMITSHPFFKLTNEQAVDIFHIPKLSYIGFVICLSCLYGYVYGNQKLEFYLNFFNTLPILVILAFSLFLPCICYRQPILYKRLKLTYGRDLERKLTLSQSKVFRKGMTQQKLPANLNNFMPDEQGPKIKSKLFYFSMMLVILLQLAQVYYMYNQQFIWEQKIENNFYYFYLMILVYLAIGEINAGIVYKIDSYFQLEYKYELEVIRSAFTVSLYHLFYLMMPSIKTGISIIIIKVIFKVIMYYIYPTNYETIKTFLRRSIMRCYKDKQAEFKEMQRRLFTKKLGILQFTDFISLVIFYAVLLIFKTNMNLQNDYTKLESDEFKNITVLCMIEFAAEVALTFLVINRLSKNERFKGLTIKKILREIAQFLLEGNNMTTLAYLSVYSSISICIANNYLRYSDFKITYIGNL